MFLHFSAWCLCRCPSLFQRVSKNGMKDSVNYQIISPKDLAKSVLSSIIEFTREDVEALLNEKAKRKDRFNYKVINTECRVKSIVRRVESFVLHSLATINTKKES
ncbi:hypothetical protein S83_029101 [Arachis hypogaea]|nr:uncharacterized protein DS421_9g272540 [Arachis hypogaea]